MMYFREKAICWKAFIPLITQPPSESRSKLRRVSCVIGTKSEPEKDSMAKLGGTAELFGPFYRERMALF
jgi:hypothetical protein